eukprot:Skav233604  [mRNA]  locus=scaffold109:47718:52210:+ [translate_table: standard]
MTNPQWTPAVGGTQPTVEEFVSHHSMWPLLPLPLPEMVPWRKLRSCRLRDRQKRRLRITRAATGITKVINSLHNGQAFDPKLTTPKHSDGCRPCVTPARALAMKFVLNKAALEVRARRDFGLTGVRAVAALLKAPLDESGYVRPTGVRQVPMLADAMVEPSETGSIDMLEALPLEDRQYYAEEQHVVETSGKSEVLFKEIESHYGFIGGEQSEFLRYLRRPDVQHLWSWDLMCNIRAVAGVSTVLKKNGVDQRKLIMQCAANYMFGDPSQRANLGMGGGSALARVFVRSDSMHVSACDEDSAFTYVKVPDWMARWQAAPPMRAAEAWDLLPHDLRLSIDDPASTYVAPKYLRLAMGGSHSVYILMRINLHHIGSTLFNYASRLRLNDSEEDKSVRAELDLWTSPEEVVDELALMMSDEEWQVRQDVRRSGQLGACGWTVEEWCTEVRRTKHSNVRTFVVIHMFGGERRPEDILHYLQDMADRAGLKLLMLTVDLADDPGWDFTLPHLLHHLLCLAHEGLIDIWIGGPPCSTVARARHVPLPGGGGPRPLRFRWALWGRPDLKPFEKERVVEANTLWLNFLAVAEAVASRGGGYLMEHPADPGCEPYPSIWITEEVTGMEERVGGRRVHLHQCPFGGSCPKLTTLSGNLLGMEAVDGVRCPGLSASHRHGKSIGRAQDGSFHTRRLQTYPAGLCRAIAAMVFETIQHMAMTGLGPTGPLTLPHECAAPRLTSWSSFGTWTSPGVAMLNEASARGFSVELHKNQAAAYVHVDDTVLISSGDSAELHSDRLLEQTVDGLGLVGFQLTQQFKAGELQKVVGYEVQQSPAEFRLPLKKMVLLREALLHVAGQVKVSVNVLRSLLGMWIFGALLKRELLSIPHAVFHFIDQHENMVVAWWPSARAEVRAMAHTVSLMSVHVGAPIHRWLFATDAMGASDADAGGYGIAVTPITDSEVATLLRHGEMPGKSIARLGDCEGLKHPDRPICPTVPFTLLPDSLFVPDRWIEVERGRWRFEDHITLGESRQHANSLLHGKGEKPFFPVEPGVEKESCRLHSCTASFYVTVGRIGKTTSGCVFKIAMVTLAEVCNCVRRLHPDLKQRVSEDTLLKYQKVFEGFTVFLQQQYDLCMTTVEELDGLLLDYRTEMELTRSQHVLLVASVEFFLPHTKGKLLLSREALRGRASAEPVRHTVPLTAECALLFAAWHCSERRMRIAAAMLVQLAAGLRPSELLSLTTEHVHLPLDRTRAATIRLGANYSTKVKREQYVLVHPESQHLAYALLEKLMKETTPRHRLFPFGYNTYNNAFKTAEQHYQLQLGTTAHSGRSGFATQLVLQGVDRKEIQARGRWLSESSFNTYIDIAGASHIATLVSTQQLAQTAAWLNIHIWKYFDLEQLGHVPISSGVSVCSRQARLPSQDVSRDDPGATRALHPLPEEPVPPRAMGSAAFTHHSLRPALKGKGKGRGRLRLRGQAQQSIFD